jgi:glutamyl-tRNA reductase
MTRAIVNRLLDAPIMRLRAEAHCTSADEYTSVARTLFGLPAQGNGCGAFGGPSPTGD